MNGFSEGCMAASDYLANKGTVFHPAVDAKDNHRARSWPVVRHMAGGGVAAHIVASSIAAPDLEPGDPISPERTGGMTGFVAGDCGHRMAGSERRAGFRNCENCGD
jgi:hypothetical protein